MRYNSKQLLFIDGCGALLSVVTLGLVLVKLEPVIGMPRDTLMVLAGFACLFALYSFSCWKFLTGRWNLFLRTIAFVNLGYCLVTLFLMFYHKDLLTNLGFTYFIAEILIILALATWEIQTSYKN